MNSECPTVSVAVPVYNGQRFLGQALDSLLAQTYPDFEIIISDNASTDATPEVARAYAAVDRRVRYVRHAVNRGAAWNFNYPFSLARGAYFKWHAHDDLVAPTFLAQCLAALDADPAAVVAYPRTLIVDADGTPLWSYDEQLRSDSPRPSVRFHDLICIDHPCYQEFGLIRREVLRQTALIGNYVPSNRVLLAHLGLLGSFRKVPEHLFISRRHDRQSRCITRQCDLEAWFDPANAGKIVLPQIRAMLAYLRLIRTTPLSDGERWACYGALLDWMCADANWVGVGADLLRAGRDLVQRAAHRRSRARHSGAAGSPARSVDLRTRLCEIPYARFASAQAEQRRDQG